jgi:rod shape-determining protein MreD
VIGILVSFFLKDINFLAINFDFLNSGIIYPDFPLLLMIFFALRKGEFHGLWIGFFAGLLEDAGVLHFSDSSHEFVTILGTHAGIYTLAGFILGKINRFIDQFHTAPIIVLVVTATFLIRLSVWLLMGILEDFNKSYSFLGPAFYTALLSPVWFWILGWLYRVHHDEAK